MESDNLSSTDALVDSEFSTAASSAFNWANVAPAKMASATYLQQNAPKLFVRVKDMTADELRDAVSRNYDISLKTLTMAIIALFNGPLLNRPRGKTLLKVGIAEIAAVVSLSVVEAYGTIISQELERRNADGRFFPDQDWQAFKRDLGELRVDLLKYAISMCHNKTQAEDLVQDAMKSAWEKRQSHDPSESVKSWVFLILRNKFLDDRRRRKRHATHEGPLDEFALMSMEEPSRPDDRLAFIELLKLVPKLKPNEQEVLWLTAQGYSNPETAKKLGLSVSSVEKYLMSARGALAKAYKSHELIAESKQSRHNRARRLEI